MTDYRVRGPHLYQPRSGGTDVHTFENTTDLWNWLENQVMVGDTVKILKPVESQWMLADDEREEPDTEGWEISTQSYKKVSTTASASGGSKLSATVDVPTDTYQRLGEAIADEDNLKFLRRFPDKCCAEVTRDGDSEPCDKVAVAVMRGRDEDDDQDAWWPVCVHHLRKAHAVPLAELIKALEGK